MLFITTTLFVAVDTEGKRTTDGQTIANVS
jgi:hypothetical protein